MEGREEEQKSRISSKSYKCNAKRLGLVFVLIFFHFFCIFFQEREMGKPPDNRPKSIMGIGKIEEKYERYVAEIGKARP